MNSPVKATISPGYRWRLVIISLVSLGFGAYCAYDWQIGYPRTKEIGMAYQKIKAENRDYPKVWRAYAEPRGWPTTPGKIKIKDEAGYDSDIRTQLIMGLITVSFGLLCAFKFVNESRRWVAMDAAGITGSGGHKVAGIRSRVLMKPSGKPKASRGCTTKPSRAASVGCCSTILSRSVTRSSRL